MTTTQADIEITQEVRGFIRSIRKAMPDRRVNVAVIGSIGQGSTATNVTQNVRVNIVSINQQPSRDEAIRRYVPGHGWKTKALPRPRGEDFST